MPRHRDGIPAISPEISGRFGVGKMGGKGRDGSDTQARVSREREKGAVAGGAAPTGGAGLSGTESARDAAERGEGASRSWRWRAGATGLLGGSAGLRARRKKGAEPRRWSRPGRRGKWAARGRRERESGPSGKKKELVGCLGWISFSYFLSLSYFFSFQTSLKLIEFKLRFEFKPYALNQIKQCTGMNAQTSLALE